MKKIAESAELRALTMDIKNNVGTIISGLDNTIDLIDDYHEGTGFSQFSVSKTTAILLLAFDVLPAGASVMCAEYGECMCDEIDDDFDADDEEHICFDEVTGDDIQNLATDDRYKTFEVWL